MHRSRSIAAALIGLAAAAGCINLRVPAVTQAGPDQPAAPRANVPTPRASAAQVASGTRAEVVLTDLTYPSAVELDDEGNLYVAEAGFVYGDHHAPTRILRVRPSGELEVLAEGRDGLVAPIIDLLWHEGRLLVSHKGKVSTLDPATGSVEHLVEGLPSNGSHQNNQLALGPDGKLYLGQGTMTNAGVVGVDSFLIQWLPQYPFEHDVPARDVRLRGREFTTINPFVLAGGDEPATARTGAFAPFGQEADDEVVRGTTKANGTILRMNPDGSDLEVYAWGLRNPFGITWDREGRLYASENGYDERGSRPIANAPDSLYVIRQGAWYGWPDFAAGVPVTDERFRPADGPAPEFLMEDHPPVEQPLMTFPPHSAVAKLATSPGGPWRDGALYMAVFGHMTPFTGQDQGGRHIGHSVLRVDPAAGTWETVFGPAHGDGASEHGLGAGPRRPVDVVFSPDGRALYVVDMGAFEVLSGPVPLPRPYPGTGAIWRLVPQDAGDVEGPPTGLSALPGRGRARAK